MCASDADIEAVCHVIVGNLRESLDHTPNTPGKLRKSKMIMLTFDCLSVHKMCDSPTMDFLRMMIC